MNFVSPEEIAKVMKLHPLPQTLSDLEAVVSKGLPKAALRASVEQIYADVDDRNSLLYSIVPEATYKRRRDRLTPEESGRAERLARVYATAVHVWDDPVHARMFLLKPHPLLRERRPIDVAMTELGALQVVQLLWRLFYGISV